MIRTKKFLILTIVVTVMSSCELDNYPAPNGDIYGKLTDNITNSPFQTEEPNGFNVKIFEKGGMMNSPITIPGKPDGTFENAWIFQNQYKVVATEGAFFPVDTVVVNVGSRTEVNFTVTPLLAVTDVTVQPSAGKITANYKIARTIVGGKITDRKTLVSKIPTVNNAVYNSMKATTLSSVTDANILSSTFTDDVTGLTAGDYYVRIAVRATNASNRFNYSPVFKVTVP